MKIAVVMAAYDAEATIEDAIASVVAQTHRDWELHVVDDGSSDATATLVAAIDDPRVRLHRIEHVGVLGAVRNVGIARAEGIAVALLDADDLWLPEKLERQAALLERRPEVGVVHTAALLLVDGERRPAPPARRVDFAALLDANAVYSSSAVVRRRLLDEHGAFDSDPALAGSPDYELWLRLAPHTRFELVDEPLTVYRVHSGQMSASLSRMDAGAVVALEKIRAREPRRAAAAEPAFTRAIGVYRARGRLPGRGRREFVRVLVRRPWDVRSWRWLLRTLV